MKLIGSTTSPYVRKVRLVLHDLGIPFELEQVSALAPESASKLEAINAARRVPILETEDGIIFDSTIICEYLLAKQGKEINLSTKLNLRLIDELCDSAILLYQQKLWNSDKNWETKFSKNQLSRVTSVLNGLESKVANNDLNQMEKDWLLCVLDWITFRDFFNWSIDHKALDKFHKSHKSQERYLSTSPHL